MRMMVRVDDLDWEEDRRETRAEHTVRLTWQVDDGPERRATLDLSDENLNMFAPQIEVLLRADHTEHAEPPRGNARPTEQTGRSGKAYRKGLRDWADKHQIKHPKNPGIPAYITPAGNYSYPLWLERAYDRWVKSGVLPEYAVQPVDLCPVCGASGTELCFSKPSGNSYGTDHAQRPHTISRNYQATEKTEDDVLDSDRSP